MKMHNHKNLIVWQKAMELVLLVYKLTKLFPKEELFGLTSQTRRAVVSIAANIAEGARRGSNKEFRHFLLNSLGSGAELETHLEIANKLNYIENKEYGKAMDLLSEIMRILNTMIKKFESNE